MGENCGHLGRRGELGRPRSGGPGTERHARSHHRRRSVRHGGIGPEFGTGGGGAGEALGTGLALTFPGDAGEAGEIFEFSRSFAEADDDKLVVFSPVYANGFGGTARYPWMPVRAKEHSPGRPHGMARGRQRDRRRERCGLDHRAVEHGTPTTRRRWRATTCTIPARTSRRCTPAINTLVGTVRVVLPHDFVDGERLWIGNELMGGHGRVGFRPVRDPWRRGNRCRVTCRRRQDLPGRCEVVLPRPDPEQHSQHHRPGPSRW